MNDPTQPEHVTDGDCWCDPEVIAVPAKKKSGSDADRAAMNAVAAMLRGDGA